MDGNIDYLINVINTRNEKLAEICLLLTQSPETFKGGHIWNIIEKINGALMTIGLALLVLFFVIEVVKTCTNLTEVKRSKHVFKLFLCFAIARELVVYGIQIMIKVFEIMKGITSQIMNTVRVGTATNTFLPQGIKVLLM